MSKTQVEIGAHISIEAAQLPEKIVQSITNALTIKNPTKARAVAELVDE